MKFVRIIVAVLLAGVVWVAAGGTSARACSCAEVTSEQAVRDASDVFVGRVDAIDDSDEYTDDVFEVRYSMSIDGVAKGEAFATQMVTTSQRGGACGVEMAVGSSYLVHARRVGDRLFTSLCSGNRAATVDLLGETLGPVSAPTVGVDPALVEFTEADAAVETSSRRVPLWMIGLFGAGIGAAALALRSRSSGSVNDAP